LISHLEKKITLRYLKPRRKEGFLNVISIFSFIGISLGVAVLIIVMSVMNGFRTELANKILGFNAHIIVEGYSNSIDKSKFSDASIKKIVKDFILTNDGEGVLIGKNATKGLVLRGYKIEDFLKLQFIKKGNFVGKPNDLVGNSISIGRNLSLDYDLNIGDKVSIMSTSGVQTIIGTLPKQETFIISSIYDSGLSEFDRNIAFININSLESLFDINSSERNLEIYLENPLNIDEAKQKIQKLFNEDLVYSWADMNSSLFSALKVERNVMFIILSLIIVVAAFNIISGLTILVKNKTRDIAILKSIGVQNASITKIFFLVGFLIGITATLFGIFLGVVFSLYIEKIRLFLSSAFNITLFPEEIYFLSKMPSEINFYSIFIIAVCSVLVTIIVSIYPARQASKQDPIKSLKYE
tara:strand:- start:66 stop:1298 length:1233 start_codon:yes stop_codon:yes gene_type:complete